MTRNDRDDAALEKSRRETTIEDRAEAPSLIYLKRDHTTAPVRLVIVEKGRSTSFPIAFERLLRLVADGAGYLATRPDLFK